ncbi:MAG: tubulin-like doman-containing protein, partial [Anaerolineae bacterium]
MFTPDIITTDGAGTAPAPQQERAKEQTLRPSFFVGSGGTGHLILLYLKAIFLMLYGKIPRGIRIVAFDTDDENLSVSSRGRQVALERGSEFCYIGRVPVAGIIQNIDNMPTIRERLPQIANLPPVNLLDGTGQIRPLGLLALLWHIEAVVQAVQDPLWELAHRENLGALDGVRIDASRGINVFQVGSLCGGNNSGQFLDLAYLVRGELERLGDLAEYSDVIGVGVLPDAFRNVRGPNLIPNTVAALHELNHCMTEGGFRATYRNNYVIDTPRPPFNIYYLLGAVAEDGRAQLSLSELCWMAAMGLYHLAMSSIGDRQESILANLSGALAHRTDDGHGTFFASYGLAELSFPAGDVATWCGYQHAMAVVDQGLLASPDDDEVQRASEAMVQAQELTVDRLLQNLAVDDTAIPLAVELQPPAHIQDAGAHAVPQMALNYVQNYRRERVDGDYRIWVRENAGYRQAELLENLSAYIQTAVDDPARGLLFAHAFAEDISRRLGDLAATLTAHRQALQAQRSNLEAQVDNSLTNLMRAPDAIWLFRGGAVREATDRYLKDAQAFLEVQFELGVHERAIAVVAGAQEHTRAWMRDIDTL